MRIWTIGHSNQPLERFISALKSFQIEQVADVRRFPSSRRHPHFSKDPLAESLERVGMLYHHLPELGGRRAARKDSRNTAWQNASFRGYADYLETMEFTAGIERLLETASARRTALMCAEALWWQCHRSLIADYLKARGHEVVHIMSAEKHEPHPYTAAASIVDGRLSYRGLV